MSALTFAFAAVIVLAIVMYVLMDGFDLGIGILFPFASSEDERDLMMNTVAPIWDGNETWLVLGGTVLFGAFPLAYAVPGIFAAGDVRAGANRRVAAAVGEGSAAIYTIHKYLETV